MIAILDYEAGNQTSVLRALNNLGIEAVISDDNEVLLNAQGVIFPGVGAAMQAMTRLKKTKQDQIIKQIVDKKIPLLGICLGCQILLDESEESNTETLGIISGKCLKFTETWQEDLLDEDGKVIGHENIKIPHMGWNSIKIVKQSPILDKINDGDMVYYVHSYYPKPDDNNLILANTVYGEEFCSVFGRDGLWAIQFHPEKSGKVGLQILENFANFCKNK